MTAPHTRQAFLGSSVKKFVATFLLAMSLVSFMPHAAMAGDDEDSHYDARVQQYDPNVELKSSSTGGAWMMMLLMGVVCVSVIFKDAKRSHLD
jgi:hypothetical protein